MRDRTIPSEHVTSEQICARTAVGSASLVDPWGHAHPVVAGSVVGRDATRCDLAVLHPSVSTLHAELSCEAGGWVVTDRRSLNGSFVDGVRVTRAALHDGAQLRFGEVSFDFWAPALPSIPRRRRRQTAELPVARQTTLVTAQGLVTLCHYADRGVVSTGEASVELSRRESALLAVLVERRRDAANAEVAFVAWHELADALGFRSLAADSDNVRELVGRVRRKLVALDLRDVIGSRQGVGYRLAATIG